MMLQEVGFSKDQAERSVEILLEVMENKLATKQDLVALKSDFLILRKDFSVLRKDFSTLKTDLKKDLKAEVKTEILALGNKLTVRMGLMTASSVTLTVSLLTLLNKFL